MLGFRFPPGAVPARSEPVRLSDPSVRVPVMSASGYLLRDGALQNIHLKGLDTGLADLDAVTHGLLPGALWVIAATPGAGRTAFGCQLVRQTATQGGSAALISARNERTEVLVNLLAGQARVSAQRMQRDELDNVDIARLASARARLSEVDLRVLSPADGVWAHADGEGVAELTSLMGSGRRVADVLVVDDLDLLLGADWLAALPALRTWSRERRFALVVTVAAEGVAAQDPCDAELRRHADVVIRLGLAGQFRADDPRVGEADLEVLRNRHGPQASIAVHFQGHYRRFTDAPSIRS